jgi:hypothetical protein
MSGQMDKCIACGDMLFYADEKVIGTWNGFPYTRFDTLDFAQYADGVPEGYQTYCLNCAPCECEFHPPFMSDKQAAADGWCFRADCGYTLTRDGDANWHRHYNDIPRESASECLCRDVDYAPCGLCDPAEGVDTGDNPEGCSAPVCMACGYTTNQIQ